MKEKKVNGKLIAIIAVVAVVLVGALLAVSGVFGAKTTQGAKAVTITVVDDNGDSTTYSANTDAEYLAEVIEEVSDLTIDGYDSDWGYYVTTVNGLYADYDADGAYWSIYVNGEYGSYGIDSQPVTDGDAYTLQYEVYSW